MKANNAVEGLMQDSGNQEWYTPEEILEVVKKLLGSIDLDPASAEIANKTVGAKRFFTKDDDGLKQEWKAKTLWLNHPFSKGEKPCEKYANPAKSGKVYRCKKKACKDRGYHIDNEIPSNADWINKLVSEFEKGNFKKGCNITFASTSEGWFRPLLGFPQIFIHGRVNFVNDKGEQIKGVTKGAVITCFGITKQEAQKAVGSMGTVKE